MRRIPVAVTAALALLAAATLSPRSPLRAEPGGYPVPCDLVGGAMMGAMMGGGPALFDDDDDSPFGFGGDGPPGNAFFGPPVDGWDGP
jgi:hypothetical protein